MTILSHRLRLTVPLAVIALLGLTFLGCQGMSNTGKGAVIGAGAGGVVGGIIGKATGSTARGAIIGAAVGGTAGAIIGNQMDKQAEEIDQSVEGATVERVGEGIQVTFESGLLYNFDSDVVRPTAQQNLQALARSLSANPGSDVLIVVHPDSGGTASYNQDLSERRARAAANYLINQGVAASRVRTTGLGELEPVTSNDTEAGREANRRVEVAIYANEQLRQQAESVTGN